MFFGTWDEVSTASEWLETMARECGLPEKTRFNMQVCLEEVLTNIVKHGGREVQKAFGEPLTISVSIAVEGMETLLIIEDEGLPFDVAAAEAHAIDKPLSEVKPGGLGVQLIKSFANEFSYERGGLGNRVTLRFLP
jgi:serine/threonine-protein kinase RsbW